MSMGEQVEINSSLIASSINTRTQGEVQYSLISIIFFKECMIEVWGNWIFNSILNLML